MEGPGVPHERVHISMPMHALIRVHDNELTFTKLNRRGARGHSTLFRGRVKFDGRNPPGG